MRIVGGNDVVYLEQCENQEKVVGWRSYRQVYRRPGGGVVNCEGRKCFSVGEVEGRQATDPDGTEGGGYDLVSRNDDFVWISIGSPEMLD